MKDVLVVYWSATGNTELMARSIADGADADLFTIDEITPENALAYDKIAFGCPAMGDTFEEAEEFFEWYEQLEDYLDGKKVAIFGSFSWGLANGWKIGKNVSKNFDVELLKSR